MKPPGLEILISTMNRTDLSFLFRMFEATGYEGFRILIINQTEKDRLLTGPYNNIRVVNASEKGLSKSRNLALWHATGDICLLADDDTCFIPGFEEIIKQAFETHNAALIAFRIETFEGTPYKKYRKSPMPLTRDTHIETLSSVEIAFKRKAVLENNIIFNELFGLNSHFETGEEYLFARDMLRAGLRLYYIPEKIVRHSEIRSASDYGNDRLVYARGALTAVKHPKTAGLWLLKFVFFLARTGFIRWNEAMAKLRMAIKGMKDYKKLTREVR